MVLLTHGWSSSLVLRRAGGEALRWAYGDWRYYALGQDGVLEALAAVLAPTRAALGRQVLDFAPESTEELIARLGIGIDDVFVIVVERAAVGELLEQLERLFAANRQTRHSNPEVMLEFVRHPEPYTLVNNSNRKIAEWLRVLGCDVSGFPLYSRWRVERSSAGRHSQITPDH